MGSRTDDAVILNEGAHGAQPLAHLTYGSRLAGGQMVSYIHPRVGFNSLAIYFDRFEIL